MAEQANTLKNGSDIFARDLAPEQRTDTFMGKGFEDKLAEAERKDVELIVGRFYPRAYLDE